MSTDETTGTARYTAAELDEAAVWLARLRAPDRAAKVEQGFQRWLAESPTHEAAFETISTAWDLSGALKRRPMPRLARYERAGFRAGLIRATAAVAAVVVLVTIGSVFYFQGRGLATGVGEQRVLNLEDGTRISLNTSSRVVVRYTTRERYVELKEGEALFEVAKQPSRPFIVVARDRRIKALGTSFIVREDQRGLAVILVEGKVTVTPAKIKAAVDIAPNGGQSAGVFTLSPGQRLTLSNDSAAHIDKPPLETVTAWRRGQVEFNDTDLVEAVSEINRYSTIQLSVETPQATAIRINGVFRAGDTQGFAAAVARSYGLTIEHRSSEIVLTGGPKTEP